MYPSINEKEGRESLDQQLSLIRGYIENEIAEKQATIGRLEGQLKELGAMIVHKDAQLELLREKLAECQLNVEGQRKLMNKLLDDISSYQRDILWYRRTYEQRNLVGLLKEKFFGKSSGGANDSK